MPNMNIRCLAEKKCQQRGSDFGWLFRNQYVLNRDADRSYPGWNKQCLAGWALHHGAALRISPIKDTCGEHVGFLLGHALTPKSELVKEVFNLPVERGASNFIEIADRCITELSGRYLVILLSGRCERVYCDPVSDIPLLYDQKAGVAGSSLGLLLDRPMQPNPKFSISNVLGGSQTLSLQHTLDTDIKRGISNHYLDLSDFSLHRHWPSADVSFDTPQQEIPEKVDQLTERLGAHIAALVDHFDCILPITGGRDSRMLLSCGLPNIAKVRELSAYRFHNPSRIDARIAREMLASMDLPFKQYFKKKTSQTQMRDMRVKMGWSGTRGELAAVAMIEEYPQDYLVLRGNIMELLRANQWRMDTIDAPFRLRHAIRRTGIAVRTNRKSTHEWGPQYMKWYDNLPENAKKKAYDFGFIEFLLPNTQGAYFNAFHRNVMINPFNDRKIIEIAISMPTVLRKDDSIINMILQRTNPFLLDFPFH